MNGEIQQQQQRGAVLLEETFYIFNKKKTVYRVKLTEKGLSLQKESNGNSKSETIQLDDIVGCRCMRRKRRKSESCVCRPMTPGRRTGIAVVEQNSAEQDENDSSVYLYIYSYLLKKSRGVKSSTFKRDKMTITLRFRSFDHLEDNMREAQRWRLAIKCLIRNRPVPPVVLLPRDHLDQDFIAEIPNSGEERRLLVFVNPKSGSGRAKEIFERRVAPLLIDAELPYDLHLTQGPNDARRFVRQRHDLTTAYSDIIIVSGDGLMFEVINGLIERPDWESACQLGLGIIPGGSGNGLAKSISFAQGEPYSQNPVLVSALNVVKGHKSPMDLIRVETKSLITYSFLSIGWGLISDIDIESERLRAIGGQRFTVWSLARLVGLRTYRGRLSYCIAPGYRSAGNGPLLRRSTSENEAINNMSNGTTNGFNGNYRSQSCHEDLSAPLSLPIDKSPALRKRLNSTASSISEEFSVLEYEMDGEVLGETAAPDNNNPNGSRLRLDSFYSAKSRSSAFYSVAASSYHSLTLPDEQSPDPICMYGPASKLPSLTQPVPSNWTVIEGEFVMVHASYQSHIGADGYIAPDARPDDGVIWLVVIRAGASRSQLLQFLLGLSSGSHIHMPIVEMIPVTAFRLEPENVKSTGHITVDGELVDYGPIQAEVMPGMSRILTR
ncbi:sphingosine kinase 2-like isoform X2 [Neocloeon triangulifer]|uniref:sphingosine kinase 2-like isoform X2 n=1 Tax=Neocloeon triangulifer TaxID=2078957 RepID=UPI00286F8484|nr:sphingosine kinase 2-like isoform X2 [Neocloeon triangulifer]